MIEVIILAAGVGSRLRPITNDVPKCMVPINNEPLIGRIAKQLKAQPQISTINVVLGYKSEVVVDFFKNKEVNFVINDDYESTNNMYSFYLAAKNIHNLNDVIIINADCIYDDEIINLAVNSNDSIILSDENFFNEESMKIEVHNNFIKGISKKYIKSENTFTSIDFYRLKKDAYVLLVKLVTDIINSGDLNSWTEVGLDMLVKNNPLLLKPKFIGANKWYEIDNHTDLEIANKLFANE